MAKITVFLKCQRHLAGADAEQKDLSVNADGHTNAMPL